MPVSQCKGAHRQSARLEKGVPISMIKHTVRPALFTPPITNLLLRKVIRRQVALRVVMVKPCSSTQDFPRSPGFIVLRQEWGIKEGSRGRSTHEACTKTSGPGSSPSEAIMASTFSCCLRSSRRVVSASSWNSVCVPHNKCSNWDPHRT